jgi:uncharacterized protein YbbK (DUF523 family)
MTALKFIASACLAGVKCRYNEKDKKVKDICLQVKRGKGLPLCPEQLAGLPTPRKTSQIIIKQGRKAVTSSEGEDLTSLFQRGANLSLRIGKRFKINSAFLKIGSPSCGFSLKNRENKIAGVTSALFNKQGIKIYPR